MSLDDTPLDSPIRSNLEEVRDASNRAKDLVRQILSFSRKEKKQLIPVNLRSLTRETLKLLRSTTPSTVTVIGEICSDCGVVLADPTQIHQLLLNLFANAVHATDEKGEITVRLQEIDSGEYDINKIQPSITGTCVKLSVIDDGTGIDGKNISRIFDPFYTTKTVGQGTGMGLSVVHGIVESFGGYISVESELGRGSTFNVFLPVVEEGSDLATAREEAIGATASLAKRQRTYFRRDPRIRWIPWHHDHNQMLRSALDQLEKDTSWSS